MKHLITAFVLLCLAPLSFAKDHNIKENKHYKIVSVAPEVANKPQPNIIEFFNYGCPACQSVEAQFWQTWKKNNETIQTERVSVTFHKQWEPLTEAHLKAKTLGQEEKLDPMLFNSAKIAPNSVDTLLSAYPKPDKEKFKAMKKHENAILNHYNIASVPAFLVNGKCLVNLEMMNSYQELDKTLKYLTNNCK